MQQQLPVDAEYWMSPENYFVTEEEAKGLRVKNSVAYHSVLPQWLENMQANLPVAEQHESVTSLFGKWQDEKCIVCGAGESIKGKSKYIREAQIGGWRVIAVDRIHGYLKSAGIVPDYTVSSDQSKRVLDFLYKVKKNDKLILDMKMNPEVVEKLSWKPSRLFFYIPCNPFSDTTVKCFKEYPRKYFGLRANYVVGSFATDVAIFMGCRKIVLIGHDLGWRTEEAIDTIYKIRPAVGGFTQKLTHLKKQEINEQTKKIEWDDFYTIDAFLGCADGMKRYLKWHPEVEFVNSSGGLLTFFKNMPFEKALEEE